MAIAATRWILLSAALLAFVVLPSDAVADRAFGPRFSVNTQGAITIAANSIESCLDSLPTCANVRNAVGGAIPGNNNNQRTMTWLDADTDPATFDSSSAALLLPNGASVLFAGLTTAAGWPQGRAGRRREPGRAQHRALQGPGRRELSPVDRVAGRRFVDPVSRLRQRHGDRRHGRPGYVLERKRPARHRPQRFELGWLGARRRLWRPGRAKPQPVGVRRTAERQQLWHGHDSAERLPDTAIGPGELDRGIVAYEGDLGTTGDGAQLQGGSGAFTALSNAVNPGPPATSPSNSNVFNSTISNAGTFVTSRTPSFQNNLGYDADLFSTTGVLGNAQTSTQVRLSTSGDAYQPGVVTIATDLYAPRITATKTVNGATANLGDTLTYTVNVANNGQDAAIETTFSDLIPAGAVYVPGSITLGGVPVTDAPATMSASSPAARWWCGSAPARRLWRAARSLPARARR